MEITVNQIKEKLATDQLWLERGILAILKYQTAQEVRAEQTIDANNVGFNGVDGQILTSFGKWIEGGERYGKPMGRRLTTKQVAVARRKMIKYAGQLYRIAQGDQ
jgi:hypothetical protein